MTQFTFHIGQSPFEIVVIKSQQLIPIEYPVSDPDTAIFY